MENVLKFFKGIMDDLSAEVAKVKSLNNQYLKLLEDCQYSQDAGDYDMISESMEEIYSNIRRTVSSLERMQESCKKIGEVRSNNSDIENVMKYHATALTGLCGRMIENINEQENICRSGGLKRNKFSDLAELRNESNISSFIRRLAVQIEKIGPDIIEASKKVKENKEKQENKKKQERKQKQAEGAEIQKKPPKPGERFYDAYQAWPEIFDDKETSKQQDKIEDNALESGEKTLESSIIENENLESKIERVSTEEIRKVQEEMHNKIKEEGLIEKEQNDKAPVEQIGQVDVNEEFVAKEEINNDEPSEVVKEEESKPQIQNVDVSELIQAQEELGLVLKEEPVVDKEHPAIIPKKESITKKQSMEFTNGLQL